MNTCGISDKQPSCLARAETLFYARVNRMVLFTASTLYFQKRLFNLKVKQSIVAQFSVSSPCALCSVLHTLPAHYPTQPTLCEDSYCSTLRM